MGKILKLKQTAFDWVQIERLTKNYFLCGTNFLFCSNRLIVWKMIFLKNREILVFLELWNSTFWPLLNFFTLLYLEPSHKTLFSWSWMNVQWHFLYKFTFFMWQWPQTIWDLDSTDNNSRLSSKFNLRWSLKVSFKRSNILKNRKKYEKKFFF